MKTVEPEWLLDELGIEYKRRGNYLWASCPHPGHNDSSPSWRMIDAEGDDRYGQHRCYGCKWGGWPVHLVESVKGIDRAAAWEWIEANGNAGALPTEVEVVVQHHSFANTCDIVLPKGITLASNSHPMSWPRKVVKYLSRRGLTPEQVCKWDIGYATRGPQRNRIVVPIRDESGGLLSYTGRSFIGAPLRYKSPKLKEGADVAAIFGRQHWEGATDVVVITEGAFNALAVERVMPSSWRVAALYGSNLHPRHLLSLQRFRSVLLATDADGAGNRISAELTDELGGSANTARVEFPPKVDCNDLKPNALRKVLNDAYDRIAE